MRYSSVFFIMVFIFSRFNAVVVLGEDIVVLLYVVRCSSLARGEPSVNIGLASLFSTLDLCNFIWWVFNYNWLFLLAGGYVFFIITDFFYNFYYNELLFGKYYANYYKFGMFLMAWNCFYKNGRSLVELNFEDVRPAYPIPTCMCWCCG